MHGLEAEACRLRGDRVGEVAGGGAADGVEAELARVGESDGDDAILEAERRKADGVVLDVEIGGADALAEILCTDQRGEAYGQVRLEALGDGQQSGVAPDVGRAGGDGFAGEDAAGGFEVVDDFEGMRGSRGRRRGAGCRSVLPHSLHVSS